MKNTRLRSILIATALWLALLCMPIVLWGLWLPLQLVALVCALWLIWRTLPWAVVVELLRRW